MDPPETPIKVKLPDSSTMSPTHQYQIPLHNLSRQAKNEKIYPAFKYGFIPIGKFCDGECIITFDKHRIVVRKKKKILLKAIVIK